MSNHFAFDLHRVLAAGAAEAAPADLDSTLVQTLPSNPEHLHDSLLLLAVGSTVNYELGVWDVTTGGAWRVVASGRLLNGEASIVPFAYQGATVYLRRTSTTAAGLTLYAKQVKSFPSQVQVIDRVHYEIHEGEHFFAPGVSPVLASATYYWKITTPDSPVRAHFTLELSCNVLCDGFLYEDPTVNVAGAPIAVHNSDRDSANAATVAVTAGDTSTADGTLLWSATFGGVGAGMAKSSGSAGAREEIKLARNTSYFVKVTTLAAGGVVNMRAAWYEDL